MNTIEQKNEESAEKLPTIESFLSKAESTIKFHLNGIDFMDEEEIRSYLIQLQLLTELEPKDSKRKCDVKYKLNKILDEYSQIIMDISQETNNSSFDVNLLTNANFLSNSSSSDSGITADIIPETQKFESIKLPYETRGRKKKISLSEYTKQAILTKRCKIMPNNEIIHSETDILENIIQDSQNSNTIEENSQELESTIQTTNSIDQSLDHVEEIEDSVSDAETVLFHIENMEIYTNENVAISANSEEMAEYSNTAQGNGIAAPKEKYIEKRNMTSEDIIKETQISQYKRFRKNDVSSTRCEDPGIIKSNKPTNQIGNFGSRYNNSLTNISSTQITSCNTISTQTFASTIPPTFNTTNNSSIGQTSQNTNTILYTALPNNKFVNTGDSNICFDSLNLKNGLEKSQFGHFENVEYVDNKKKARCIEYFDIPQTNDQFLAATTHTQNKLPLLENLLPEDAYFAKSSTSHNSFIGNTKHFDAIQTKESLNIFPEHSAEDYSNSSSRSVPKNNKNELFNNTPNSRNEYETSSSEANVTSYNEEQENVLTMSSIDPNKNVLKNLMETHDSSASFQTNLMKDLQIYSEMNEYKMETSIAKIETKSNNPFLCKGRKELLCEAMDPKSKEQRRNKLNNQDVETMTDMFADMFCNYIRLADLNKSDLHMKIKNDSNIL